MGNVPDTSEYRHFRLGRGRGVLLVSNGVELVILRLYKGDEA